ncbi:MAG: hypothetical protein K6V36_09815, partial [Anaerolineae bacterium]|nr:hypothetical protein [Anaerolineae bacterium]
MGIGGQSLEQAQRLRHAVAPVAEHARGSGPCPEIRRGEQLLQQFHVDDIVRLVQPQRFQQVMLIICIVFIQTLYPLARGGEDQIGVAARQFDAGTVADAVFRLLEQLQQFLDRFSGDGGGLQERPALAGNAVDAAVGAVAAG